MEELLVQYPVLKFVLMWAFLGLILGPTMTKAKTKKQAIVQLIICGPWCWMLFVPISIRFIYRQNKALKKLNQEVSK